MSNLNESQERAIEQAEAEGMTVVKSSPTLLLIDLDDDEADAYFMERIQLVTDALNEHNVILTEVSRWPSKSGKGLHIKMKLSQPLGVITRLLLQACLGSDRLREFLSLLRKWDGCAEPSLLFKPPAKFRPPAKKNIKPKPTRTEDLFINDDDLPF